MPPAPPRLLFVCLGNICRSPLAEAVFADEAKKRGLAVEVDSAGTGAYHAGETPDERTIAVLEKHGVPWSCRARQVRPRDFAEFDYIFAADKSNLEYLRKAQAKGSRAKVLLFSHYSDGRPIADPYYGGREGFDKCYEQCVRYSRAILDVLENGGGEA